jgi:hypothetical protein
LNTDIQPDFNLPAREPPGYLGQYIPQDSPYFMLHTIQVFNKGLTASLSGRLTVQNLILNWNSDMSPYTLYFEMIQEEDFLKHRTINGGEPIGLFGTWDTSTQRIESFSQQLKDSSMAIFGPEIIIPARTFFKVYLLLHAGVMNNYHLQLSFVTNRESYPIGKSTSPIEAD